MIRILSHAEIFSFAALKCLQSGNMDSRVFYGTLKSMSMAIMDAMSMDTVQTLGLHQMRREAAIESAPKGSLQRQRESFVLLHLPLSYCLTGRLVPFYKENVAENHKFLVKKTVTNQAKPNPSSSSSSRKPKAKSGKNKTMSQETPTN